VLKNYLSKNKKQVLKDISMKLSILLLTLSLGLHASATSFPPEPPIKALCMESGQKSSYILAEIYENEATVDLSYMATDGTVQTKLELTGAVDSLTFSHMSNKNGDNFIIVQSIAQTKAEKNIKILVCAKL
jgi:hypothetical protein